MSDRACSSVVNRSEYFCCRTLRDQSEVDPRLPSLPVCLAVRGAESYLTGLSQRGKQPLDVIVDFLSCLWEYAKERITAEIGAVADLGRSYTQAIVLLYNDASHVRLRGRLAHSTGCLGCERMRDDEGCCYQGGTRSVCSCRRL